MTLLYIVIKEKFEQVWVIGPYFVRVKVSEAFILSECGLFWEDGTLFWVEWWVGVYGALFWMSGMSGGGGVGGWGIVLGRWVWVWMSGGVHCLIIPLKKRHAG